MTDFVARITAEPIRPGELDSVVLSPANGAIVGFQGIVRDHDGGRGVSLLEYQAHPDAERFLLDCCRTVSDRTGLPVAAIHRVGSLVVGDLALLAVVAAPHRAEAFAACADLVELIKTDVPIWKRQHFADGVSEWVGL
ncbi:MAG TPA: molybdenum cofactor biosynthesis protein MoaE [Diaminobutyricibacter sp.]